MHASLKMRLAIGAGLPSLILGLIPPVALVAQAKTMQADSLRAGFASSPAAARPRVWWHWMNGNVTKDGIAKDLEWMHRIGIGGAQAFDAALETPKIVDHRLVYMSPEWKDAFRFAAERADALGLELGIASSPGWSETGAPWVKPEEGMKKLVWSETIVEGGKPFSGVLPPPPRVTGPFQALPVSGEWAYSNPPSFYSDVAVFAVPLSGQSAIDAPNATLSNNEPADPHVLLDDDLSSGLLLPASGAAGPGTLTYRFTQPQTVRSVAIFIANAPRYSFAGPIAPRLEASDDGDHWRTIAELAVAGVPTTASFPAVTASRFRLVFGHGKGVDRSSFSGAPGLDLASILGAGGLGRTPPTTINLFQLSIEPKINGFEQKAGFAIADDYYALDPAGPADERGPSPKNVIDVTARMKPDGSLDWNPPAGRWKILRLGYSLLGTTNHPATAEATGLEVDKYDGAAVARYFETYLAHYRSVTGDALIGDHGMRAVVTDSTEVGPSNWTPALLEQFQRLRGYDARPWLPTLTGQIVGSRADSDAFLYDFRRTLADLVSTEHYATVARIAAANRLTLYGESLEGTRETLGDDLDMRRFANIPMAAMWAFNPAVGPASYLLADMRGAASVAHLYGKPFVAAESLTSIAFPWALAPVDLQPMIDAEFLNGVNRPVIHTSVHQPLDKGPGLSLNQFGQYFTRLESWADMAGPWIDYISRNSFMMQKGHNVADVLCFYGEDEPLGVMSSNGYPIDLPKGFAYDYVSATGLIEELSVREGRIVSRGGASYRALQLRGSSRRMTLPVLRKIAALVDAGALVTGAPPEGDPSLADDRAEYAALRDRLWGGSTPKIRNDQAIEAAFAQKGVAPDFEYEGAAPGDIQFAHRALDRGHLYFVDNRKATNQRIEARFRITGYAPELWHADTGRVEPVSYRTENGRTMVPLSLRPYESVFVVFRKPSSENSRSIEAPSVAQIATIDGPWEVAFQPDRGAPASLHLDKLASLSEQTDPGIRYFSGVATYRTTFRIDRRADAGTRLLLDVGKIGDVAEVRINGRYVGTTWKAPYRVDLAGAARIGRNQLEIRVANLWVNRLIGDQQPNATKVAFTVVKSFTPRAPLRPSGLIGPVTIIAETER